MTEAIAYPPPGRMAAAILTAVSRGSLLVLLALILFFDTRLGNQLRLMRAFFTFCLVPAIAAWVLGRAFATAMDIQAGTLVLHRRGRRVEIPCASIARIAPWTIPLPSSGVWLHLKSGRRFPCGLAMRDPVRFIEALVDAGAPEEVRTATRHPAALYARFRHRGSRPWYHPVLAFMVFALVPTLPLFRLHQWIAYGGTFGEYYVFGLKAYLLAFAIYWVTCTIYLVLYAAALRAVAETIALPAAWLVPRRAASVRRAVEIARRCFYYVGVPALVIRLFLQ